MSEVYDQYKAFAESVEAAKKEIPTARDEVIKIMDTVRENHPDISASPVSEVFVPQPEPDIQKVQIVILRWGKNFARTELSEIAHQNALHRTKPTIHGSPMPAKSTTVRDADFQYVVASVADDDIPYVTVAGLNDPTRIDAADFLSNPIGTFRRGLFLALRNPVQYSRSTIFSGSHATVRHEGFLCKPDGELVKLGTTGLNFTPAWNVFERENTHKPIQR